MSQATLPGAALRELFLLNNAEYVLANAKVCANVLMHMGLNVRTPSCFLRVRKYISTGAAALRARVCVR